MHTLQVNMLLLLEKRVNNLIVVSYIIAWISSAVLVGMLFGGMFFGCLSDKVGRKPCLLVALTMNFMGALASVVTKHSVANFVCCFLFAGIGIGGSVPVAFSMGAELFPSKTRGQNLTYLVNFWVVGSIFTSILGWLFLGVNMYGNKIMPVHEGGNWRIFMLTCLVPIFMAIVMTLVYIPESPVFLLNSRQYNELYLLLHDYVNGHFDAHSLILKLNVNLPSPLSPQGKYSQHASFEVNDNNIYSSVTDDQKETMVQTGLTTIGGEYFGYVCLLSVLWFCVCFATYGILLWINMLFSYSYASTVLFSLGNIPGMIFSYYYIDYFGRRNLLIGSFGASALSLIGFACALSYPQPNDSSSFFTVFFAMFYSACNLASWNGLNCLSVEIFPASVRPSVMGILAAFGRIGAISAQLTCGFMLARYENGAANLLCIISATLLVGAVCSVFLPETTGDILSTGVERREVDTSKIENPIHLTGEDEEDDTNEKSNLTSQSIHYSAHINRKHGTPGEIPGYTEEDVRYDGYDKDGDMESKGKDTPSKYNVTNFLPLMVMRTTSNASHTDASLSGLSNMSVAI